MLLRNSLFFTPLCTVVRALLVLDHRFETSSGAKTANVSPTRIVYNIVHALKIFALSRYLHIIKWLLVSVDLSNRDQWENARYFRRLTVFRFRLIVWLAINNLINFIKNWLFFQSKIRFSLLRNRFTWCVNPKQDKWKSTLEGVGSALEDFLRNSHKVAQLVEILQAARKLSSLTPQEFVQRTWKCSRGG